MSPESETVLPPELRQETAARRRTVEKQERDRLREERSEEFLRNYPVAKYDFMVAGVHVEDRPQLIQNHVHENDRAFLVRDRGNRHSKNAVEVRTKQGFHIGYVPEMDAKEMAPLLDQGHLQYADFKKILTGGRCPILFVVGDIYRPDATIDGAVGSDGKSIKVVRAPSESPAKPYARESVTTVAPSTPASEKICPNCGYVEGSKKDHAGKCSRRDRSVVLTLVPRIDLFELEVEIEI